MALKDIVEPRREIPYGETTFSVRAASPFDLEILLNVHAADMIVAFGRVKALGAKGPNGKPKKVEVADVQNVIVDLIRSSPELVAGLVAICADEPDMALAVKRLPVPVLTQALLDIWELTFTSDAELKKFLASVTGFAETVMGAVITQSVQAMTQKSSSSGSLQ